MCVARIKYTASGSAIKSGPAFLGKWVKLTPTRGLAGFGVIPRRYSIAAELMVRIHSPPAGDSTNFRFRWRFPREGFGNEAPVAQRHGRSAIPDKASFEWSAATCWLGSASSPRCARQISVHPALGQDLTPSSDTIAGYCQLKRPWYARWRGSSGRGTPLLAYYAAPLSGAGPEKGALGPLS